MQPLGNDAPLLYCPFSVQLLIMLVTNTLLLIHWLERRPHALCCPLQVPMIVKALHKQLKEKSVKTRQCCFNMLTELVNVLPGALTQHIPVLIPGTLSPFWQWPASLSFGRPVVLLLCPLRRHFLTKRQVEQLQP